MFTYRPVEFSEAGNTITEANLQAQRWNNTLDQWGDYGPVGTDNTTSHSVTVASVSASNLYTWWTLVDSVSALPVKLVSFTAQAMTSTVNLKWITANEVNASYFTIQKTQDFSHILALGNVTASGNSSIQRNYSMVDLSPFSGISFYRLKIMGKDGTVSYSQWQQVTFNGKTTIHVYPNPASDYVNISGINITSGSSTAVLARHKWQSIETINIKRTDNAGILNGISKWCLYLKSNKCRWYYSVFQNNKRIDGRTMN